MKDLEFHVDVHNKTEVHKSFAKALETAVLMSISDGGKPVTVDVVAWSAAAARAFSGESGVESYREDPDASVFRRFIIQAEDHGRIA